MSTNHAITSVAPATGPARVQRADLQVAAVLAEFVEQEVLPGLDVSAEVFWHGLATLAGDFADRNRELLATREAMQTAIDGWHRDHPTIEAAEYRTMLEEIGYLRREPEPFRIDTADTDAEIATLAGPQLVVPVSNARYALNAANARWGSLYDALYGTDALGDRPTRSAYDPVRGARVVAWVKDFLDDVVPLIGASHASAAAYRVVAGALVAVVEGDQVALADPAGEFRSAAGLARSCWAIATVTSASRRPSNSSRPCESSTAGVVIRLPTLRTSSSARPRRRTVAPSGPVTSRSGSSARSTERPPRSNVAVRSPRIRPSQLR